MKTVLQMKSLFATKEKDIEMKSPEMIAYEEKRSTLKAEVRHLEKEYDALLESQGIYSNYPLFFAFSLGFPVQNHYDDPQSDYKREKRCGVHDRLTAKERELATLEANKPEKIHFEIKLASVGK